ncbi:hypothetical protein M8C21_020356 [Ambrosia artemisiifolia]|uniref:Uncharacterized protein n=1 Tax=Ambrosia artemisiifolia TaxID=4212 RepID=A0AAD5GJI6_AMBAR|nr:hypothetical protein M8C21_020356 [Ambrosia artemisiifolia]
MAISQSLVPAVLLFHILISYKFITVIAQSSRPNLMDQIREAELNILRLETEKRVEEITSEFDHLQYVLLTIKNDSSKANESVNRLEEEVYCFSIFFVIHLSSNKCKQPDVVLVRFDFFGPLQEETILSFTVWSPKHKILRIGSK